MSKQKLLARLIKNQNNVKYNDFTTLLNAFGFILRRTNGSHHFYKHKTYPISINTQNKNGEAKPYQIEQFLRLIEKYNLKMDGED